METPRDPALVPPPMIQGSTSFDDSRDASAGDRTPGDVSILSDLSDTLSPPTGNKQTRPTAGQDPSIIESSVLKRRLVHSNSDDPDSRSSARSSADLFKLSFDVGLIGRDDQVKEIHDIVEKVSSRPADLEESTRNDRGHQHQRHVLLVSGPSGVGKTSLANQGLRLASKTTCVVGRGKFSLTNTNEPLAVLKEALSQIGKQIQDEEVRQKIRDNLDEELLSMCMPDLCRAKRENQVEVEEDHGHAMSQLRYATVTLLSLLTAPVVIMIDDAQWADATSLQLLLAWATEESLERLLLVLCFRDGEVDDDHALTQAFLHPLKEQIGKDTEKKSGAEEENAVHVHDLFVQELNQVQVSSFLSEILGRPEKETLELAEFFHKKTRGNPFYVISLIKSLVDKSLLSFNLGSMKWQWDLEAVRKNVSAAENVVDVVRQKLQHCQEAQAVLPVAAMFGATFSFEALELVLSGLQTEKGFSEAIYLPSIPTSATQIREYVAVCVAEGYVDQIDGSYRFVHDRIQEAALVSLPPLQLSEMQFLVGKILAQYLENEGKNPPAVVKEHILFTTVNLLNEQSEKVLQDQALRMRVIRLNMSAGTDASENASFSSASSYFQTAAALLPQDCWNKHRQLSTDIHSKAAHAAYCAGEAGRTKELCNIILQQEGVPLLDKVPAYHQMMTLLLAEENNEESIDTALYLLKQFGITFPKNKVVIAVTTISGLLKTKRTARRLTDQYIEMLPVVSDARDIAITKTLDMLVTATFSCRQELTFLVIQKVLECTLKVGLTAYSSIAFSLLGIMMVAGLEDFKTAKACYDRAIAIDKRLCAKHVQSRLNFVLHEYLYPWFAPQQNCLPRLDTAYRQGLMSGDLESFGWATVFLMENSLHAARPLSLVNADCSVYTKQLGEYSQYKQRRFMVYLWQASLNLSGKNDGGSILTGDVLNLETEISELEANNDVAMPVALRRAEIFLAIMMGDFERCADLSLTWTDECLKRVPSQAANFRLRYYAGLSCLIMAQTQPRKYKRFGYKNATIINSWVKKGNPNCLHMDALLDAERARVKNQTHAAIKSYESAVVLAGKCGMLHEQALASERYADLLVSLGRNEEGKQRLTDAIAWYQEWGASAKVDRLQHGLTPIA